jgi:LuxR family maltose regulon positive regulatory protein
VARGGTSQASRQQAKETIMAIGPVQLLVLGFNHLARAAHLRPRLTAALPYRAVQTLLELTRAHLALTDVAGARTLLREARIILHQRPHLGTLPAQAAELQSQLDMLRQTTASAARLTTAELRLLPLLSTHMTFREMAERLYVSRQRQSAGIVGLPQTGRLLP